MDTKLHNSKNIGIKVTPLEYKQITELVDAGVYLNISDFIRDAIRDKLESLKVIKIRDVDYETAKKEVIGYFKRYKEAYPHEVANDLELDLDLVVKITKELIDEGKMEVIE